MSQQPGVFSAFPDKINRHWKVAACVAFGVALVFYVSIPATTDLDSAVESSHMRGSHQIMTEVFNPGPKAPLNPPHGGKLVNLVASEARADELLHKVSPSLVSLTLTDRQLCDIELLMNGGFSPLDTFMDQETYNAVVESNRLGPKYNNIVFPMPITLDVSSKFADTVTVGTKLALRDPFFNLVGILTVTDKYTPDKTKEAQMVFGTTDQSHPAVDYLMNIAGPVYLGGSIEGVRLPQHFDFNEDRLTPLEVRAKMEKLGWSRFVAFQTRNPMHRAHIELTRLAANQNNLGVLIHPVVGMTKPGDVDYSVRVRCYKAIVNSGSYYKKGGVHLALLPLAMRMAGPREALWHAIIRKNYGASHFIVGRDHAGCKSSKGDDFYGAYDAQELVQSFKSELGIEILKFQALAYVPERDEYMPKDQVPPGAKTLSISGTKFRKMMAAGEPIPEWFSHPDVIKILREVSPPLDKRGFAVFFTGLSGSGKTTITTALIQTLQSLLPTRRMTILDGDVVRTHLSKNLGFSIEDRNTNVARMGWVAAEVVRHGGIAICSTISPFHEARADARRFAEATGGGFALVHISTSAEECAARDVKGLYQKAKDGLIALTGVSHPYEFPDSAELTIDAGVVPVAKSVDYIVDYLVMKGYILPEGLPPKYSAVKPETVLKAADVLTEGITDPASRLCKKEDAAHVGAVLALGDSGKPFVDELSKRGVVVRTVSEDDIVAKEKAAGADASKGLVTPLSTPLTEAQTVQAGWDVYYPARQDSDKTHKTIALVNPRLLVEVTTMLRVDPCFKVLAVKVDAAGQASLKSSLNAGSAADAYVNDYYTALDNLKQNFPERVILVSSSSDATDAARKFM